MTVALGIVLVILLIALLAVALRIAIASPFRALGILVAGMAVHNFLLMVLLRLGTPDLLVRLLQAWKEAMELHFPASTWLRVNAEVFDRLVAYKARRALPTWDATLSELLERPE